jgi:glycosyltransferase involved in cell wall biosynthesis
MANLLALVSFKVFPPQMGGQKGVALFYRHLAKHHTIFVAGTKDNESKREKFTFLPELYSNKMMWLNLFSIQKLQKIIQQHNIECIIAEHSYTGWLGFLLRKKMHIPFIIHSHNLESYRFKHVGKWWWKIYWHYEKQIHKKADHNFFISEEDLSKGIKEFQLNEKKCSVITYGVDPINEKKDARNQLKKILGIGDGAIFLFNGTLNYKPNIDAVTFLLNELDPLLQKESLSYKVVITGNQVTPSLRKQMATNPRFIFNGFVDDTELYYQGANIFLNVVDNDSGIKTKVVEALANNCIVLSTKSGATGIPQDIAREKLITVNNQDAQQMVKMILLNIDRNNQPISEAYLNYFNWDNIAVKASQKINNLLSING